MTYNINNKLGFSVPIIILPPTDAPNGVACEPYNEKSNESKIKLRPIDPTGPLPIDTETLPEGSPLNLLLDKAVQDELVEIAALAVTEKLGSPNGRLAKKLPYLIDLAAQCISENSTKEKLNAHELSLLSIEVVAGTGIAIQISRTDPRMATILFGSELVEVLRPRINKMIQKKITEEKRRPRYLGSLPFTGYQALGAAVEIASWPARILNTGTVISTEILDTLSSQANQAFENIKKEDLFLLTPEGSALWIQQQKNRSQYEPPLSKKEKATDTSDQTGEPAKQSHTGPSDNKSAKKSTPLSREAERNVLSQKEKPDWIPFKPFDPPAPIQFIQQNLSGSLSFSNAGGNFHGGAQIGVTVGGSKQAKAGTAAAIANQTMSGSPGAGSGTGAPVRIDTSPIFKPIKDRWDTFIKSEEDWTSKKNQLINLQNSFSSNDSPEDQITKTNAILTLISSVIKAEEKLGKDALLVHNKTRKGKRVEYRNNKHGVKNLNTEQIRLLNVSIKKFLHESLQVPKEKKLKESSLAKSGSLKELENIKTYYARKQQELEIARPIYEIKKAVDEQNKALLESLRLFQENENAILNMETSDQTIDPSLISKALKKNEELKQQILKQTQNLVELSTKDFTDIEVIKNIEDDINKRSEALSKRTSRYEKIHADYQQFYHSNGKTLEERSKQEQLLEKQISEITVQCPSNIEENKKLFTFLQTIKNEQAFRSFLKQTTALGDAYQALLDNENTIKEMENSEEPIDAAKMSEALKQNSDLMAKIREHIRELKASSASFFDIEKVKNFETTVESRSKALQERDLRYAKMLFAYQTYCVDYQFFLMPTLTERGDTSKKWEILAHSLLQKECFEKEVNALIAHCPENKEKNAELRLLLENVQKKHALISFSTKSDEDKSTEILSLKAQIKHSSSSSTVTMQNAIDAYHDRAAILALQLIQNKEYQDFSAHYIAHATFLHSLDFLSPIQIELISEMSINLKEAIVKGNISPKVHIHLLENLESKYASKVANLDPLRISIGELISISLQSKSDRAKKYYHQCIKIQPQNPQWPIELALAHLDTLHYSAAEKAILESLTINSEEALLKGAITHLVADKYNNASLLLEWLNSLSEVNIKTPLLNAILKVIHTSSTILTHPSLLKKWLPQVISTPFKGQLVTYLNNDKSTDFNPFNSMTLASRVIPVISELAKTPLLKNKASSASYILENVTADMNRAQKRISTCLALYHPFELYTKYANKELSRLDFTTQIASSALDVLPLALPLLETYAYKSAEAKKEYQQKRPNLCALIQILASKKFANTIFIARLTWKSSDLLRRIVKRFTGYLTTHVSSFVLFVYLTYKAASISMDFFQLKKKMENALPLQENEPPKPT